MKRVIITKKNVIRIILIILLLFLFGVIFRFSNQNGEQSTGISREITEKVTENVELIQKLEEPEKERALLHTEVIIRKLAHFSLYTLVGILVMVLLKLYSLNEKKRILYSFCIGVIYAMSDEIHQLFIPERTGQRTDVLIDSCGVAIGIMTVIVISKLIVKYKELNKK